jgi:hypothetical protein
VSTSREVSTSNIELRNFLSRPVVIKTDTWTIADSAYGVSTFQPWSLYFNNASIKNKLQNYAFIKCKLHLKIVVNASPFLYGAGYYAYSPLDSLRNNHPGIYQDYHLIPYSQRNGIWVYPHLSQGGEIELPFFYPRNYLDISDSTQFAEMGQVNFIKFTTLRSANGGTSSSVNIQVLAWASDVELMGATVTGALQSDEGDEYGEGIISKPASAVAAAAYNLQDIPVIGPFATATQIGAGAISRIAKLFGYTNPPSVDNVNNVRVTSAPSLATSEISYPYERLNLDPKTELSVDPRIAGLPPIDEMTISYIAGRPSYIGSITWSTNTAYDTLLANGPVCPSITRYFGTTVKTVYMTPIGYIANAFTYWRGDIILTFKVINSKYHRGRLRFSFDPTGTATSNIVNTSNMVGCINEIFDISEKNEFEVRIPYTQARPWLESPNYLQMSLQTTGAWTDYSNYVNGWFTLRVFNDLTAPIDTSDVTIMVFVKGADNFELALPKILPNFAEDVDLSEFSPQADIPDQLTLGGQSNTADHRYLVNFGEAIFSIRQVIRRMCFHRYQPMSTTNSDGICIHSQVLYRFPWARGYDPSGQDSAHGVLTPASLFNYNFVNESFLSYFAKMYVAHRGSVNWMFNPQNNGKTPFPSFRVSKQPLAVGTVVATNRLNDSTSASLNARIVATATTRGDGGAALMNGQIEPSVPVTVPNQTYSRFMINNPNYYTTPVIDDGGVRDMFRIDIVYNPNPYYNGSHPNYNVGYEMYVGAGTDMTFLYFLNVPVLYHYTQSTT